MAQDTTRQHQVEDTTNPREPPQHSITRPWGNVPGLTMLIHVFATEALQRDFSPHGATSIRKERTVVISLLFVHSAENFTLTSTLLILS